MYTVSFPGQAPGDLGMRLPVNTTCYFVNISLHCERCLL